MVEWNRDVGTIRDDPLYDLEEIYDGEKLHDTQTELRLGQSSSKANAGNIHATMIKRQARRS